LRVSPLLRGLVVAILTSFLPGPPFPVVGA
jgi:hypothetical protein